MKRVPTASGDRGASILELALITPIMAIIVMGIIDLTRGYQLQIRAENAAGEAAAFAQLHPNDVSCTDVDDVEGRAAAEDSGLAATPGYDVRVLAEDSSGDLSVPVTGCGGDEAVSGERVRVEVDVRFDLITPGVRSLLGDSMVLTGTAEVEVQG